MPPATKVAKRKRAVKAVKEVNSLQGYSDVFERVGEERRKRDSETAKRLKAELPNAIKTLKTTSNTDLFTLYDEALIGGYSSHEIMLVLVNWKEAIKKEMLKRMERKPS